MSAIAVATLLAFISGALLVVVMCVNVTDYAPSDWTDRGRLSCWLWSLFTGSMCALVIYGSLQGATV